MTPRRAKTLSLLVSQTAGAQAHLSETTVRLRAFEGALDDVAAGIVFAPGLDPKQAHLISGHIGQEIEALDAVFAALAAVRALARALEVD